MNGDAVQDAAKQCAAEHYGQKAARQIIYGRGAEGDREVKRYAQQPELAPR